MELMKLTGKHVRLQWELEAAYSKLLSRSIGAIDFSVNDDNR